MALHDGLYDLLVTERLLGQLIPEQSLVETLPDGGVDVLADAVARQLADVLEDMSGDGDDKLVRQLELVNALLHTLRQRAVAQRNGKELAQSVDLVSPPARLLKAVDQRRHFPAAPQVGLGMPWLFTAAKGSPSLLQEIRSELASADRVDILVSFITVSGVRKIADVLRQVTALSAQQKVCTPIRVLTTTYTGATELRAIDELARLPGCEIRVSLDGRRTRLHAKAWMFHRASGFGSAYIGSANLSGAAMTGGLEWTVKLSERAQPGVFSRAQAHFETLWDDNEFQFYDPDNSEHRRVLASALARESGVPDTGAPAFFDLQPKNYQQEMLEQLVNEREHGRHRNLVVAATGTGKTMVAAFDYRRTCGLEGGQPRLLFVAHREEILRQALHTWRAVLRDPEFGNLLASGRRPERLDHVFATIDSLTSRQVVQEMGAGYWHTVIVDECHRLAADRFDAFVTAIRPRVLLGLTATPERSDGKPISHYFDARPDGSPAVELRLWHALDQQLLAPFEYYACDDATDFSEVPWDRPGERQAVDNLVTGNDVRARLVVNEWQRLAADPRRSRALVFCVSVVHARFMADWFNAAGLPAACVVGATSEEERRLAPQRLARGELCALVTVDLYNEGVDLPSVDTLLLLRPTQSALLFQQQIGRGLRLAPGKESCLILDFVGQQRVDFRFDRLLSVLTGLGRQGVLDAVEHGFSQLPPGCHIQLQRQTREQVLHGLKAVVANTWRRLRVELQAYAALQGTAQIALADFLREQSLELEDVYRRGGRSGWTELKRDAGLMVAEPGPEEAYFSRRMGDLCHLDDPRRLNAMRAAGASSGSDASLIDAAAAELQMLAYQVDGTHAQVGGPAAFMARLAQNPAIGVEMTELADVLQTRASLSYRPLPGLEDTPLCLHAGYHIREILTAVGWLTASRRTPFQSGRLSLNHRKTELLFVTLDKSAGYHDRIAYRDYAISATRFHWQTQNNAGPDNASGRRYMDSGDNGWNFQLFVRTRKGEPYLACGRGIMESIEGDRPMSVVWNLEQALPAKGFREFSILRGA